VVVPCTQFDAFQESGQHKIKFRNESIYILLLKEKDSMVVLFYSYDKFFNFIMF